MFADIHLGSSFCICLKYACISSWYCTYHITCISCTCVSRAGCFSAGESGKATPSRQRHFLDPLYQDPNAFSNLKCILNIPHSALLCNQNWFGSQLASNKWTVHTHVYFSVSVRLPCRTSFRSHGHCLYYLYYYIGIVIVLMWIFSLF